LQSASRFTLNSELAAAKVIDGEAIIINVVTGHYYSLEDSAALVWQKLAERSSVEEIARELSLRFEVDEAQAGSDVERLCAELVEQQLLLPVDSAAAPEPPPAQTAPANGRLPYGVPRLQTFTDMADLLAFDPPLPGKAPDVWEAPA
jgi:hypothetical protein